MADSLISLLSPVAAKPSETSLFAGKADFSVLFAGADAGSDAFSKMLVAAGNVNLAQANPAKNTAVAGKNIAHAFPIQPSNEVDWLQTTGSEVVAEPLPEIDEVQATDMAAIAFAPQVMQQLPTPAPKENASVDIDVSVQLPLTESLDSASFAPVTPASELVTPVVAPTVQGDVEVSAPQIPQDTVAQNNAPVVNAAPAHDAVKTVEGNSRTAVEKLLEKQAKNAVVHQVKTAIKKPDSADNVASAAAQDGAVAADVGITQTVVQKGIMEAPVALELQGQKALHLKAKSEVNQANFTLSDAQASAALPVQENTVLAAINVGDVAQQQNLAAHVPQQVMTPQTSQPVLNAADATATLDEAADVNLDSLRGTRVRKNDAKQEASDAKNQGVLGLGTDKAKPEILSFVEALAHAHAQTNNDAFAGQVNVDDATAQGEVNLQIGGESSASAMPQAIGGDSAQRALDMNDVRMSSSVQLRQTNLAYASVHEQIQVQVKQAVTQSNGEGTDSIRVRLNPLELGQLQITMKIKQDGTTHVKIEAERSETLDMLQRDAKGLASALADAGLQADAGSLEFSMSGDGRSGGEAQAQQETAHVKGEAEAGQTFADAAHAGGALDEASADVLSNAAAVTQNYTVKVDQGIDIHA